MDCSLKENMNTGSGTAKIGRFIIIIIIIIILELLVHFVGLILIFLGRFGLPSV